MLLADLRQRTRSPASGSSRWRRGRGLVVPAAGRRRLHDRGRRRPPPRLLLQRVDRHGDGHDVAAVGPGRLLPGARQRAARLRHARLAAAGHDLDAARRLPARQVGQPPRRDGRAAGGDAAGRASSRNGCARRIATSTCGSWSSRACSSRMPTLAASAALAIWFDIVPWLRRTAGNVVFFFVWIGLLTTGATGIQHDRARARAGAAAPAEQPWTSDLPAMRVMQWSIEHQAARGLPDKTRLRRLLRRLRRHHGADRPLHLDDLGGRGRRAVGARAVARWPRSRACCWPCRCSTAWPRAPVAPAHAPARAALAALAGRAAAAAAGARATGTLVAAETLLVLRARPLWWWAAWPPLWGVQAFGPRHAVAMAMLGGWTLLLDVFSRTALRDHEHRTRSWWAPRRARHAAAARARRDAGRARLDRGGAGAAARVLRAPGDDRRRPRPRRLDRAVGPGGRAPDAQQPAVRARVPVRGLRDLARPAVAGRGGARRRRGDGAPGGHRPGRRGHPRAPASTADGTGGGPRRR